MMNQFDPLPQAPLSMPKQQLENPVTPRAALMRFFSLFLRDPVGPMRREH